MITDLYSAKFASRYTLVITQWQSSVYKLLSLTYKVLTTSQPDYLRNL